MTGPRAAVLRLVDWQLRRPWVALAAVALVTAFFALLASRLTLQTRYDALLPDHAPSVQELRRLEQRASSAQTVLIVLEGPDRAVLRRYGDELVPELLALGPDAITSAEDGVQALRAFLAPRLGLFLDRPALEQLDRDVEARWDREVARETGAALDDDPPPLTSTGIEDRVRHAVDSEGRDGDVDRFPDGYYEGRTEGALVVVTRSPVPGGDLARGRRVFARVRAVVDRLRASAPERAAVQVSYAGDLTTSLRQYGVITQDLLGVGATGIALVLGAVLLYFLRLRALLVMAITIAVGLTWTFGLTQVALGHLNVATSFLFSIVAGNGINVGILYQARYFEERNGGLPHTVAIRRAVEATWMPTAIAALASAASYASLLITDFRAFRDFGFIAATGMLVCWVVKTLMVPPLLMVLERDAHAFPTGWRARAEMAYGRPFAWLVGRAPGLFVAAGAVVAVAGVLAAVRFVRGDPMEYNLHKTEIDRPLTADVQHAWTVAQNVLGGGEGALVIAADTADEASDLEGALRARWREAPAGQKPFVAVHGLADLVAPDQSEKIPTLLSIGARLERARARGAIDDTEWTRVRELLPPDDLRPYDANDLPPSVAERFTDARGVRGALVYIESNPEVGDDLRKLVRFADAFRETRLETGKVVRGSGSPVILADMLRAVVRDVPRSIALSVVLTIVAIFVAVRGTRHVLSVLFALVVGCAGVAIYVDLAGARLNYLNFAALPITFGIGVDYAVNVVQRHAADGQRDVLRVLRTSGGAVVLCSLTTMLGYVALLTSHNGAIRSLGAIAAMGELSCLLAAVLVMPSLWHLLARVQRSGPGSAATDSCADACRQGGPHSGPLGWKSW
jgi:predicted RND superfamily exporter protein